MDSESEASSAQNEIPNMEKTTNSDTMDSDKKLKNPEILEVFDEGKNISCVESPVEGIPSQKFDEQEVLINMDGKEIAGEEEDEDEKPDSFNVDVVDEERTVEVLEDTHSFSASGIMATIGESTEVPEESEQDVEQEDSLDKTVKNEEDAKMSLTEDRVEDESNSGAMQDLDRENSLSKIIDGNCWDGTQSQKIEWRDQMEEVDSNKDAQEEETFRDGSDATEMPLSIQVYELEAAMIKHVEPEELVDQQSASETENVVGESGVISFEPETQSLAMSTSSPNFETESNECDAKKIHADTHACLELSSVSDSESSFVTRFAKNSSHGSPGDHNTKQCSENYDLSLESLRTPASDGVSYLTNSGDSNAESTEKESVTMPKCDSFSALKDENNVLTESEEEAKFISRNVEEISEFITLTVARKALALDHPLEQQHHVAEMQSAEAVTETILKSDDRYVAEEHGEGSKEVEEIDSNAHGLLEEYREQRCTDLLKAIDLGTGKGTPSCQEKESIESFGHHIDEVIRDRLNLELPTVSAIKYGNYQSKPVQEEPLNGAQVPSQIEEPAQTVPNEKEFHPMEKSISEQSVLELHNPLEDEKGDKDQQPQQTCTVAILEPAQAPHTEDENGEKDVETLDEKSIRMGLSTADGNQLAESIASVVEKSQDAAGKVAYADIGNGIAIQQPVEIAQPFFLTDENGSVCKDNNETVEWHFSVNQAQVIHNQGFEALELPHETSESAGNQGQVLNDDCNPSTKRNKVLGQTALAKDERRATVYDCCGILSWLRPHQD